MTLAYSDMFLPSQNCHCKRASLYSCFTEPTLPNPLVLTLVSWALGQLNTPNAKKIWHASFDGDLNIVESLVNRVDGVDVADVTERN